MKKLVYNVQNFIVFETPLEVGAYMAKEWLMCKKMLANNND